MTWEVRRAQEFDRYERYLRRELPRVVRQRLEIAASEFSGPLENRLRGQLIDIVRDSQSQLFQQYRGNSHIPDLPSPVSSTGAPSVLREEAGLENSTVQGLDTAMAPADFDLSVFFPQPPVDESYVNPMNIIDFTMLTTATPEGGYQAVSDSGYGSIGVGSHDASARTGDGGSEEKQLCDAGKTEDEAAGCPGTEGLNSADWLSDW